MFEGSLHRRISHVPHPFILRPPLSTAGTYKAGDRFEAEMILVGKAIRHIPYVIYAWEKFGHAGIGKGRGQFTLENVLARVGNEWNEIYSDQSRTLIRRAWEITGSQILGDDEDNNVRSLKIELITPLRIKHGGAFCDMFEFPIFLTNLARRISLLHEIHCDGALAFDHGDLIEASRMVKTSTEDLRWMEWTRYSARQRAELKMGGLIGKIRLTGNLNQFIPYLKMGELLHVGKGTSMGMGMFTLGDMSATTNRQE